MKGRCLLLYWIVVSIFSVGAIQYQRRGSHEQNPLLILAGFGLTLAQAFITQHRGMLESESESGRTCFTVLLPVERTAVAHSFLNTPN